MSKPGLPKETRQFVGGPVSPEEASCSYRSDLRRSTMEAVVAVTIPITVGPSSPTPRGGDAISVYFVSLHRYVSKAVNWAGDALVVSRVYWGCACWDRVQLLGEIARGG